VQRAKVIVTDAGVKRLTECESCGEEKYIAEGETVCDECKARPKRKLLNEKAACEPQLTPCGKLEVVVRTVRVYKQYSH
jgi:hypothetical protein